MENIFPSPLPEVVFASSDNKASKQISRLEKKGKLRKIAPRIYSPNFDDTEENIISRNLFLILGKLYPGALLSHRSALEFKPTAAGHVFITYSYTKKIQLPGITLRIMEGPPPMEGDNPFWGDLYASQMARALLENLQESRQRGPESKTLALPVLEEYLEQEIRLRGEEGLNALRDKAKAIARKLDMQDEMERLNKMISALLATHPSKVLTSPIAIARAFGNPYDPERLELFHQLFLTLQGMTFPPRPDQNASLKAFRNFAFFEAYFSNYIEGTEFEVTDAKQIIATQTPMPARGEDSHDILGTYQLVSSRDEMRLTPEDAEHLLQLLLRRHQVLLKARLYKNPGAFKDRNNRAGDTHFVDHTLVRGTLDKGFDFYRDLKDPFARAAYMMFMVSEVHPFLDGNGRIARVMMNAELVRHSQTRIIIPTVYREDYLLALKRLSRKRDPAPYIRMLQRAQAFSAVIEGKDMDEMEDRLVQCNAFRNHDEAHLIIPGE